MPGSCQPILCPCLWGDVVESTADEGNLTMLIMFGSIKAHVLVEPMWATFMMRGTIWVPTDCSGACCLCFWSHRHCLRLAGKAESCLLEVKARH